MSLTPHHGGFAIFTTIIAALVLTIIPLPNWLSLAKPEWMILVLIYWCIALPDRVGILLGWCMGLLLDVASGTLLGQNALSFGIVAFLAIKLHQRIRVFPLWQQALSVLLLVALHQMISLWIRGFIGQNTPGLGYWIPSLTSMLLWPVIFSLLRGTRRHYKVR